MAQNTAAIFLIEKKIWAGTVTTANTSLTDPTTGGVTIVTAGANGSYIQIAKWRATIEASANMLRMFAYDASTYFLLDEKIVSVASGAPSATVEAVSGVFAITDFDLASGWTLVFTTHLSEEFDIHVLGGDY